MFEEGHVLFKAHRKAAVVMLVGVVVITATILGRHLIDGGSGTSGTAASLSQSAGTGGSSSRVPADGSGATAQIGKTAGPLSSGDAPGSPAASSGSPAGSAGAAASPASAAASTPAQSSAPASGTSGALPAVPVFPTAPQIVRTATIDLRLGSGTLRSTLTDIAALAATDGGYVESSSMTGGTARTSPVSGSMVIHVLDADFSQAISQLSTYGRVTSQQIEGKDVTDEVAANAASLQVLQEEVNLLQGKLSATTDINTFLQIEDQLFPVEQQLQQLQNQQAVLESSAELSTITVGVAAPGAPVAPAPVVHAKANAATTAWRYLRHNSLAVLDGLAVGVGWALPVLVLLGLAWLGGTRVWRRRRQAVTPA